MLDKYRFISARTLLNLERLAKCQLLPEETWAHSSDLCHVVFVSHRWEAQDEGDPFHTQLAELKHLVKEMVVIARLLSDESSGADAVRNRVKQADSLIRHGTLQAAHLVFRTLCSQEASRVFTDQSVLSKRILDVVGFWYDFSCLPQGEKTAAEEQEFRDVLNQGIVEMAASPHASTLILRWDGDGYLNRGWCYAESNMATSKDGICKPMMLWCYRLGEDVPILEFFRESGSAEYGEQSIGAWSNNSPGFSTWEAFEMTINATSWAFLTRTSQAESRFARGPTDTTEIWQEIIVEMLTYLASIRESESRDLFVSLSSILQRQGLGCKDERDYILVTLLWFQAIASEKSTDDLSICHQAIERFTSSHPLLEARGN